MPAVFVVGAGGVGKTTLIDRFQESAVKPYSRISEVAREYMREKEIGQTDLQHDSVFWSLQVAIVQSQLSREEKLETSGSLDYISDRSIVDALVYGAMREPRKFPMLGEEVDSRTGRSGLPSDDRKVVEKLFKPLLGRSTTAESRRRIREAVYRYRGSLVILVHPFASAPNDDDGVRLVMDHEQLQDFTRISGRVLRLLQVPFFEMRETELDVRLDLLRKATYEFSLPSPLANLEHFVNLSAKKVDRAAESRHYRDVNLPFYLKSRSQSETGQNRQNNFRCLTLTPSTLKMSLATPETGKITRFVTHNDSSGGQFLLIQFHPDIPPHVVKSLLYPSIRVAGELYSFLGCSVSGLKERKAFLWKGSPFDADSVRQKNGDFTSIKSIPKQIARFSLLLSSIAQTDVIPREIKEEGDVISVRGGNFTDGCGKISRDLAEKLFRQASQLLIRKSDKDIPLPPVYQIRLQGIKGVLAVDSTLDPSTVVYRPSMKKFQTTRFPHIGVCDYSRPFSYGNLNRQFICLLSGLGIADGVFLKRQQEHFDHVDRMMHHRDSALMLLEWRNMTDLLVDGNGVSQDQDFVRSELFRLRRRLVGEAERLKILVPKSRRLFGVAEPPRYDPKTGKRSPGLLRQGECLVRLTFGEGVKSLECFVVVGKSPCYLLGDIRRLRAVSGSNRPELRQLERDLVDCVVFPIEGDRPHSEEIAGSDLDGDQYFVCWDPELIPLKTAEAYAYPAYSITGNRELPNALDRTGAMIDYFSIQNKVSRQVGRVDALFRAWANEKGVLSPQCERLGQIFSRVVDSAKSGERVEIDSSLAIPRDRRIPPTGESKFVWQRMEFRAAEFVKRQQTKAQTRDWHADEAHFFGNPLTTILDPDTEDKDGVLLDEGGADADAEESFLLDLVSRNHLAMTPFSKFRLIMQYFGGDADSFMHSSFADHVNYAQMTPPERGYVVDRYGMPPVILENAIRCHSRFVGSRQSFLQKYCFDSAVPWSFYWRSKTSAKTVNFPEILAHALRSNTDALLLLEAPDGVVVILRFSRKVLRRSEMDRFLVDDMGSSGCSEKKLCDLNVEVDAFFVSGHFALNERYTLTDRSYTIDLSELGLQLYRKKDHENAIGDDHRRRIAQRSSRGRGGGAQRSGGRGANTGGSDKGQTFIHLKIAEPVGASSKRHKTREWLPLASSGSTTSKQERKTREQPSLDLRDNGRVLLVSVDLQRFNRRIRDRRHPLIRKVPVLGTELFVFNRESNYNERVKPGISYLDLLIEDESSRDDNAENSGDGGFQPDGDSVEGLEPTYIDLMNQFTLKFSSTATLENRPEESIASIVDYLRDAHQHFTFCSFITRRIRDGIMQLAALVFTKLLPLVERDCTRLLFLSDISALLSDLDIDMLWSFPCHHLPEDVEQMVDEHLRDFTDTLRRWDVWLSLSRKRMSGQLLSWLKSAVSTTSLSPLHQLIYSLATEQAEVLLHELSDDGPKTSTAVSWVKNLRLDPARPFWFDTNHDESNDDKPATLPTITLYGLQSIPQRVNFVMGEHVTVARQNSRQKLETEHKATSITIGELTARQYQESFPPLTNSSGADPNEERADCDGDDRMPKSSGCYLGKVVRIGEAPFSVSIKLVAPTYTKEVVPNILSKCLSAECSVYWQVASLPANVVTHVRNTDAIRSLLDSETTCQSCSPSLLPYLLARPQVQVDSQAHEQEAMGEPDHGPFKTVGANAMKKATQNLNRRQALAVERMFSNRLSLVCGPGGTGKSTVALKCIFGILENSQHRILVTAETNLAVDNLATRFMQENGHTYLPIRLGRRGNEQPKGRGLDSISLETIVRNRVRPRHWQHFDLSRHSKVASKVLAESRIVFATCSGAGDPLLNKEIFESVLMDEATMTTQASTLCALVHGCCHCVLIGDHKQLGPHALGGDCTSMFERLCNNPASSSLMQQAKMTFLNEQHRMHPMLCSFPSRRFYEGELMTAPGTTRHVPQAYFKGGSPVRFVNVPDGEEKRYQRGGSWYNEEEIKQVMEVLDILLANGSDLLASDVTILTFYQAQKKKIEECLMARRWGKGAEAPHVSSVDGFQGKENQIVLCSVVRSGESLGFCNDERRVNVLLTRAKRGLVVIGRRATLMKSPLWSEWIREAEASQS